MATWKTFFAKSMAMRLVYITALQRCLESHFCEFASQNFFTKAHTRPATELHVGAAEKL